jgi:hypothetical protein
VIRVRTSGIDRSRCPAGSWETSSTEGVRAAHIHDVHGPRRPLEHGVAQSWGRLPEPGYRHQAQVPRMPVEIAPLRVDAGLRPAPIATRMVAGVAHV